MLARIGLVVVLVIGLVGAGVVGALPANAEMKNEQQVINQPASGSGTGVLINEVEMNPRGRDLGREWVELYNPTQSNVNIGNFAIKTQNQKFEMTIPAGTVIGAGQFYVVTVESEKFSNVFGENLKLVNSAGSAVDTTPSLLDRRDDTRTWQRMPDGSSVWRFVPATQDLPNDPSSYKKEADKRTATASAPTTSTPQCLGSALCLEGKVFRMVDTNTLYVRTSDGAYRVDLSLTKVSRSDSTYKSGSEITKRHCLGSNVLVDQDDDQSKIYKVRNTSAIKGVVYCGFQNLNQQLLDSEFVGLDFRQCFVSEFASQPWAIRNGCQ